MQIAICIAELSLEPGLTCTMLTHKIFMIHKAHVLLEINYTKLPCNHGNYHLVMHWPYNHVYFVMSYSRRSYCIAGIFHRGVISAFFAVKWDPRKINPRKFVTRTHVCAVLQTVVSVKHVVAILWRLQGSIPFVSSACCCWCLVLCETAHFCLQE